VYKRVQYIPYPEAARRARVRQARLQLGVSMEGGASSEGFTTATGPTPSNQGYTASTDRSVTAPAPAHAPAHAPAPAPAPLGGAALPPAGAAGAAPTGLPKELTEWQFKVPPAAAGEPHMEAPRTGASDAAALSSASAAKPGDEAAGTRPGSGFGAGAGQAGGPAPAGGKAAPAGAGNGANLPSVGGAGGGAHQTPDQARACPACAPAGRRAKRLAMLGGWAAAMVAVWIGLV